MPSRTSVAAVLLALVWSYAPVVAAPRISEVLANTEDDAALEYFSISNVSCDPVSFSWYSVVDASGKTYRFPNWLLFEPFAVLNFFRSETKITLNNENETLALYDASGSVVDTFSYVSTTRGVPIVREAVPVPACLPGEGTEIGENESEYEGPSVADVTESETAEPSEDSLEPQAEPDSSEGSGSVWADVLPSANGIPESTASASGTVSTDASFSGTVSNSGGGAISYPGGSGSVSSGALSVSAESSVAPPSVVVVSNSSTVSWGLPSPQPASNSRASPETLTLFDNDADGAFDYVQIRYSENLSWIADASEYSLYSATGGLYETKIATATGYFDWAEYSWPFLRLSFSWRTLPKTAMRIDASTSSEFRIKSVSVSKLRTESSWLPVFPLWLTTSFSGYSSDRISFNPPFAPIEESGDAEGGEVSSDGTGETVPAAQPLGDSSSGADSESPPTATGASFSINASGTAEKVFAKVGKTWKIPVPDGLEIVPSSGIDRVSAGKYRYVCFSSVCPVSFRAEGIPKWGKGRWTFSDGRERFGTSTATLGKKNPAEYSLEYVLRTDSWEARIPIRLSVVSEESGHTISQTVSKVAKTVGASVAKSESSGTWSSSVKMKSTTKADAPSSKSENEILSEDEGSSVIRTVSLGVAALFLWLFAGAWFAWYFRSWYSEESP